MKSKVTFSQRLLSVLLAVVLVCTMLQCTLLTAFAGDDTIDALIASVNADGKITLSEATSVNRISVLYDALDATTQSGYTTTVDAIKAEFYTLISDGLTTKTSEVSQFNKDYWGVASQGDSTVRVKFADSGDPAIAVGPHAQGKTSVNDAPALDGLEVMINRLYQYQTADKAGFALQFTPWEYQNSGVNYIQLSSASRKGMLLYFDLKNGQIIINSRLTANGTVNVDNLVSDPETMARLTLAHLEHKVIAIGMNATSNADYPYQLTIKISGDNTPVVVDIPAKHYSADITNNGKVNIGIARGYYVNSTTATSGAVNTSLDLVGYRNTKAVAPAIEAINNTLTNIDADSVKETNAAAIYEAISGYEKLTAFDKGQVSDPGKLELLKTALYALMMDGYTTFSAKADFAQDPWGIMAYADGVARYTFGNSGSISLRHGPRAPMELDGLELKFSGLHQTAAATNAGFGIQFTPSTATIAGNGYSDELTSHTGLLLYFDLANGKIILNLKKTTAAASSSNVVYRELVTNDKLKLSNLENKVFTVGFKANDDAEKPYSIIITVADGSAPLTVDIPADCYEENVVTSNGFAHLAFNRGYYTSSIGSPSDAVNTSFDFVGYRDMSDSAESVEFINETLAALDVDTLTEASAAAVNKMEKLYATLIPMEKEQISDEAEIEALIAKMATLVKQGITQFENFTADYWATSNWFEKTADYARFTLAQTSLNPQMRIGPTEALEFDGLELKFNNLQLTSETGTVAGFGILYALSAGYEFKPSSQGLLLYIDAKSGDLILNLNGNSKYAKLIENSDVLKLSSLEYNAFTVKTVATGVAANPYKVTVMTADGKSVSADIPADCFDASKILSGGKTYVSICRGRYDASGGATGSVYNRFDLVGYKNVAAVDKVNSLIASIPANVTLSDSGLVNRAAQYYENLTDLQKSMVVGVDKLNAAVIKVEGLYAESLKDSDYTIMKGNDQLVSKVEDMNSWWMTEFTALEEGGIRIDWLNATLDIRASVKEAVNMNGLRLKFNRLLQKGAGSEFAIYFADGAANEYNRYGDGDFALVLNASNGTLKAATGWNVVGGAEPTYVDIIEDDLLKYDSIGGGEFIIGTDKQADGTYKVTVTVGGNSVEGIIPTTVFDAVSGKLSNPGNCYICVSAWNAVSQELDFIGYKTVPDVYAPDVIAWIDSLPETITLADCELLDNIYTKLLIANEEQLAAITNKDKFYAAMKAYRKLFAFETEVFSHDYIALKDATKWWPSSFKCTAIENDGGIRISWINGGRDVRQGYNKKIRLDGLKLQFNALHKTKETADAPSFAVMLSDDVGAAWTYNSTVTTRPLAIVLDTKNGTLTAEPSGSILAQSDKLKYENLEYGLFYIEFNQNDDKLWQVDVITPTGTVSGVMSVSDFIAGERFTNLDSGCYVTLTAWTASYATIEWTGIGQSTKHHEVSKMIDELRVIDKDSGDAIKAARKAYDALPEYVQDRVANYDILTDAEAAFNVLDENYDPIPYVEEKIAGLGVVNITSKEEIDDVIELYNTLSTAQQNRVKNKAALQAAIEKYYALYAKYMDWDSCVYAPLASDARFDQETLDSWWNGTLKFQNIESGGVHIDMINAARDHRFSFGSYELDGLNIQLSDFKVTGEGAGSGQLAISVGPFGPYDYGKGLSTTAKRTFVFVLNTNEGTLTLNAAGNKYFTKNKVLFEGEELLYSNIEGKNFSLMFEEIDNFNYTVRFLISDGTLFSTVIPSSFMIPLMAEGKLTDIHMSIGAWNSNSYQSVNLISVFDNNNENAPSQVLPVIEAINGLPEAITLEDEAAVREVRAHYRTLLKKGLKEQVNNYAKLDKLLLDLSVLWDANDIDPYEYEEEESEEAETATYEAAPVVTETPVATQNGSAGVRTAIMAFLGALALGVFTVRSRKIKTEEEER